MSKTEFLIEHRVLLVIILLLSIALAGRNVMVPNTVPDNESFDLKTDVTHINETVWVNITVVPLGNRVDLNVYALADSRQGSGGPQPFNNASNASIRFISMSQFAGHVTVDAVDGNGNRRHYLYPYNDSFTE